MKFRCYQCANTFEDCDDSHGWDITCPNCDWTNSEYKFNREPEEPERVTIMNTRIDELLASEAELSELKIKVAEVGDRGYCLINHEQPCQCWNDE